MATALSDVDADSSLESYSGEELKIVRSIMLKSLIRRCAYVKDYISTDSHVMLISNRKRLSEELDELRSVHYRYAFSLDKNHPDFQSGILFLANIEERVNEINRSIDLRLLETESFIGHRASVADNIHQGGGVPLRDRNLSRLSSQHDFHGFDDDSYHTRSEVNRMRSASIAESLVTAQSQALAPESKIKRSKPDDWIDSDESIPILNPVPSSFISNLLPKFKIEPFNGNPKEWPNFSSSFRDMVHNVVPSNAQRLAILKQLLTSEVRMYLSSLLERPETYFDALRELRKRYGHPQVVARAHLKSLLNIPSVKDDDFTELGKLSRTLHGAMHALAVGGYEQDLNSAMTLEQIVGKLPPRLRSKWGVKVYKMNPSRPTLKDLAAWLDEIVMGDLMTRVSVKPKNRESRPSRVVLATETDETTMSEPRKCLFCTGKSQHTLIKCFKFKKLDAKARAEWVKDKKLCFRCLNGSHKSSECEIKVGCTVDGCTQRHHFLLHGAPRVFPAQTAPTNSSSSTSVSDSIPACNDGEVVSINHISNSILLTIVPLIIFVSGKTFKTHALLNNGSDVSLIREDVANKLGLKGPKKVIKFGTFHGQDPKFTSRTVNFSVKPVDESFQVKITNASTVPDLKLSKRHCDWPLLQKQYSHLRNIKYGDYDFGDITVLIGAGVQSVHQHLDSRRPPNGVVAPYAIKTPFGWCCVGKVDTSSYDSSHLQYSFAITESNDPIDLNSAVEKFWTTDSFPLIPNLPKPESEEDKTARQIVQSTTVYDGIRYNVGLPWRSPSVQLPNNYDSALRYFKANETRILRDPKIIERYSASIHDLEKNGYARKLPSHEIQGPIGRTNYLCHHYVINPKKPEKLRVVFNASAKFRNVSLNDVLLKGPNLLSDLSLILLLFREKFVSLSGDIKQMFLQVGVRKEDRSALRFLWREPGSTQPPSIYEMQRQIFGAISSPFVCTNVLHLIAKDFQDHHPEAASRVVSNFYVDNLLDSYDSEEEAAFFAKQFSLLLSKGGFHLNQWVSSSRKVLQGFTANDLCQPTLNLDLDELPIERTLGVLYDSNNDSFCFKIQTSSFPRTKRTILSFVSTLFDPLGFLSPVIVTAKMFLQQIWASGLDWDDQVDNSILSNWYRWVDELKSLESLNIPRPLTLSNLMSNVQLHSFSDASKGAFGAVVYLRVQYENGSIRTAFVIAKSRVAPLKSLSIPRLELQGAVVSIRLIQNVIKTLRIHIDQIVYWSDSKTVVQWIQSKNRKFHTFVCNRIAEILEFSSPAFWRHIPGVENPSDEASRGLFPSELLSNKRWFAGPAFLSLPESEWPGGDSVSEDDPEVIPSKWIGNVSDVSIESPILALMSRCSNFYRCRCIVAIVLRFIDWKCKKQKRVGILTIPELRSATKVCIKIAQSHHFQKEISILKKQKSVPPHSSLIKLTPQLDSDGILRVGGRLDKGDFNYNIMHPIIVPHENPLTRLIVSEFHLNLRHPSTERLLAEIRQQYWVIKGRLTINRITKKCIGCRKLREVPSIPLMSSLPRARIQPFQPPFTNCGLDYFGPYTVAVGRRREKRYVLLITCLVTRAVHLEVTATMDTNSFIMAFQRFENRRGRPAIVYSDNGTQIVAGDKEIRQCLKNFDQSKIAGTLAKNNVEWHFSPPSAPHFGGVWESLVKSAKVALNSILIDRRSLNDEMFSTIIIEVESLLNGRPLTHVSVDPNDPEPLTPNHFLLGRSNPNVPIDHFDDTEIASRKGWRAVQVLVNHFWRRWLKEYLPTLNERRKWMVTRPNLAIDDLVLIVTSNTPRGHWPVGRVIRAIPGKDGVVRSAVIKTSTGEYVRPVAKLCLLEKDGFGTPVPKPPPAVSNDQ